MKKYLFLFIVCIIASCDDVNDKVEDILGVPDISDKEVQILAPAHNISTANTSIKFSWEELEGANEYQIQIARPSFEEAEIILTDKTLFELNYTQSLSPGTYQWRIRAMNGGYKTGYTTYTLYITE